MWRRDDRNEVQWQNMVFQVTKLRVLLLVLFCSIQKYELLTYVFDYVQLIITHKIFIVVTEGVTECEVLQWIDKFILIHLQPANPSASLSLTIFMHGNKHSANMNMKFDKICNERDFTKKFYKVVSFEFWIRNLSNTDRTEERDGLYKLKAA
jgi:hypothetical protein